VAWLVRWDGRVEELRPSTGPHLSLEQLQTAVEGYIEGVRIKGGWIFCNEDGLREQLPQNLVYPRFVGNIVLCQDGEVD